MLAKSFGVLFSFNYRCCFCCSVEVALVAAALIGLFCLIMIIGFYDSLIMRWCIEKIDSVFGVRCFKLWASSSKRESLVLFFHRLLARCWAFCWSWWPVSQSGNSTAGQTLSVCPSQCRPLSDFVSVSSVPWLAVVLGSGLNYVMCAFEDNLNGRQLWKNKHELRWPRNARKTIRNEPTVDRFIALEMNRKSIYWVLVLII